LGSRDRQSFPISGTGHRDSASQRNHNQELQEPDH